MTGILVVLYHPRCHSRRERFTVAIEGVIQGLTGPKGVIHPGEMSGTPWVPTVHGVAKDPVTGTTWRDPKTGKPIPIGGAEGYIPVRPKA